MEFKPLEILSKDEQVLAFAGCMTIIIGLGIPFAGIAIYINLLKELIFDKVLFALSLLPLAGFLAVFYALTSCWVKWCWRYAFRFADRYVNEEKKKKA